MSVLIIAPEQDDHALAVAREVEQLGKQAQILDLALFPERALLRMNFGCCADCQSSALVLDGHALTLDGVESVLWRRAHSPRISDAMGIASHRQFALNEAIDALAGMRLSLNVSWINDPEMERPAGHKAYQLTMARKIGLTIPETLITNDPDEARRFIDSHGYRNVIYKSFGATDSEWRETRLLTPAELPFLDHVRHAPVIFQTYVEAVYDLRITVVGDRIFAAAIHSQQTSYQVDCRVDIANAKIEAVELPPSVCEGIHRLMHRLGLVYGAIDMRLAADGRYVFLEINPAGQWMFVQVATGQPIAAALAKALVSGRGSFERAESSSRFGALKAVTGLHDAPTGALVEHVALS
jgi:glutathione synthase/RimK-type ligase-like ATP-grasp enzyme